MKRIITDVDRIAPWIREKSGGSRTQNDTAIGLEVDGVLEVGVTYDGYTGPGGSISIHSRCDDPRAPNRLFYFSIFDYPFNQLKVEYLYGLVDENNDAAQRVDEHLGFKHLATLPGYFPGRNAIIYVMQRVDCRWLALGSRYMKLREAA